MTTTPAPFAVMDCALITLSTGLRSHNLLELRDHVARAPLQSIYHHFYEGLLRPSFDDPVYRNDFAVWAGRGLRDLPLAERLGGIDPLRHDSLEQLRQALLDVVEERLSETETIAWAPPGSEFFFLSGRLVIFDTKARIQTPKALKTAIQRMTPSSIYFHFIEAHRREPIGADDFSTWLRYWGPDQCTACDRIAAIDYHFFNLHEIRSQIVEILGTFPGVEEEQDRRKADHDRRS